MLRNLFWTILILSIITTISTSARAQGHDHELRFPPAASSPLAEAPGKTETPEAKAVREERDRLAACERAKLYDPTAFSYNGYRHAEAHCKEWVRQLQESVGNPCCSSPYTGECRVSRYDFATKEVEIDGMMSPVPETVKRGVVNGLEPSLVLVCASRKYKDELGKWHPGTVYCIGRDAGL